MSDHASGSESSDQQVSGLRELLASARAHGEMTDTRQWIDNLERMMEIAWEIITPDQRQALRTHADMLALLEAAGQS